MVEAQTIGIAAGIGMGSLYAAYRFLSSSDDEKGIDIENIESVADSALKERVRKQGHVMSSTYLRRDGVNIGRVSHTMKMSARTNTDDLPGDVDTDDDEDVPNQYGFVVGPSGFIRYAVLSRIPVWDVHDVHLIHEDNMVDPSTTRHFEIKKSANVTKSPGGVYTDNSPSTSTTVQEVFSKRREEHLLAGMEQFTTSAVRLSAEVSGRILETVEELREESRKWRDRSDDAV